MTDRRAQWKGHLKVGELSCGVALYTAASTADRISFRMVNEATGNRLNRVYIDSETEEVVDKDDQIKGFEIDDGRYVEIDPSEIAEAIPDSDKTLSIEAFISCGSIDRVYFDKPYYLIPEKAGGEAFVSLREGMRKSGVAAIARTVLFRRLRTVLIRPHDKGMIATTLNFDYEVRSSDKAFKKMPKLKTKGEMLDLARHIISTKMGSFDAASFDDRYEAALAELVKAKIEGKALPKQRKVKVSKPNDLLAALRESAGMEKASKDKSRRTAANTNKDASSRRAKSDSHAKSAPSKTKSRRKAG